MNDMDLGKSEDLSLNSELSVNQYCGKKTFFLNNSKNAISS